MNQRMKKCVDDSVQELRLIFSICIIGRIKVGFLTENIFFQGGHRPLFTESVDEESHIGTIVPAISSIRMGKYLVGKCEWKLTFPDRGGH